MNDMMNNIMNDKKSHNIVSNSFAFEPDGLLAVYVFRSLIQVH